MSTETTPTLAGRRIGIDLKGGESISFRCHGEPTPAFLEAMKALGEAAADYVNSGGLQNDSTQQTNEH